MRIPIRPKGDISSAFSHLGGKENALEPHLLTLKKQITPQDPTTIQHAYQRLLESIEKEAVDIKQKGSSIIPQITLEEIKANGGRFPQDIAAQIQRRGCVVIRQVIPEQEACEYKQQIQRYVNKYQIKRVNCVPGHIEGYPKHNPQVFEVYWTKSQVTARSHAGFELATMALNQLWHADEDTVIDWSKNMAYCDRLQIHKPGDVFFDLEAHVDNGSLERWQDPEYRQCYTHILNGEWERHDPFDATHRVEARMDYYSSLAGRSVFRNFQGCVAISDIKANSGAFRTCPLLKEATALFMMKPLTKEYIEQLDFIGASPGLCHSITKHGYPQIIENMVSAPELKPGDAVFWHCDQIYSFEPENKSETDSSILYIPTVPICRVNSEYLKRQRDAFTKGLTPPDFPGNHFEENVQDRAKPEDLNEREKLNMGFAPYPELPRDANGTKALEIHHKILGLASP